MISKPVPERVPAKRYQWLVAADIRIALNTYAVYFNTMDEYENTLADPFELARIALEAGCSCVPMYVVDDESNGTIARVTLDVHSVLRMGRRLEVAKRVGVGRENPQSV